METRLGRDVLAPQPGGPVARGFRLTPVLMVLPAVVVLLAITVFPLVSTLRLTVMSWELTRRSLWDSRTSRGRSFRTRGSGTR